ncbi:DUF4168 domain-containing protein [Calothrix sp. PCC 6303]|uniref:DUF4168 domain-containing protein n=1 Tax=Calothrix sp. PCC 6303 TaxID=1170562 RepID=UPI0002A0288F|nr:DUF4168 domain-containing protein [Calothrix sp. PCC 6303]AFZ04434.1 hypothetical protein Cal6303_5556 [Calothrix sp. PCC 6303]
MTEIYYPNSHSHKLINSHKSIFSRSMAILGVVAAVFLCSSPAKAQNPPNKAEMTSYAKAMLAMEAPRQQAFDEIKKLVGGNEIPQIVCNDPKSLNNLPGKAKNIAVNYCAQAKKIVEENGLTTESFNRMTVEVQNSENLKNQMFKLLIDLQKVPASR